ncbi:MAG: EAL domain-containing protein [Gammaproteobacteria bacterium]|nr:EAL domain-containing protein [Gammaproteobacteria bacterium]
MNWRVKLARCLRRQSLRQHYLGVAVFLVCVVVASAVLTERYVSTTSRNSADNIETRNQIQQLSRNVRNSVWGAEYALQSYVLSPAPGYRATVLANLQSAQADTAHLRDLHWVKNNRLQGITTQIIDNLRKLDKHAVELMDIRADVDKLFPSARLMDDTLAPTNENFQTAAQLALDEIAAEQNPANLKSHLAFENARHAWSQMISAFRLYVVRRAGIYNNTEQGLLNAGHDVSLMLELTQQYIQELSALEKAGRLGLQATESLHQLEDLAATWAAGFEEFRLTQETGHWRNDAPLIQNVLQPLFAEIWAHLDRIDEQLEAGAVQDVSIWTEVGQILNRNLLLLSLLAIVFISLGFIFFERTILEPLSQITRAMKAIAKSEPHARLPRANSVEARNLIEAFAHMRRNVHERQVALRHQALHDALTGLPNRALIKDRLQQLILSSERDRKTGFCLLMIDLDRFKEINDTLGHQAGDNVLCEISDRLNKVLRKSDTIARLGGDEFAILLPEASVQQAQEIAQLIADTIEKPHYYKDRELPVGASIGIAVYPEHGRDTDTLFKHADIAMYVAKQDGLPYSLYSIQHDQHSIGRLALISEFRTAISEGGLILHYQPKLDMHNGAIVGVEALLRWPKWSSVKTEYLIKTAENTSLIKQLTHWVLRTAIRQLAQWQERGIDMPIAVNLSTWNLSHSDIDETIRSLLLEYNTPPDRLELEITENAMMTNPDRAHAILDRLQALGVKLTVDDYGTGFSSLAYLKTMPVGQIKIDRSFVGDMLDDENDAVIVRSTIDLAHNLGMKVVAEGVSSAEIWDLLEILGCDTAQGYYIAHPMSAENLERWLRSDIRAELPPVDKRA